MAFPVDRKGHWGGPMEPTIGRVVTASDNPNDTANAAGRVTFNKTTRGLTIVPYGGDIFFKLGNSSVTADTTTSHIIRSNVRVNISTGDKTHVQIRRRNATNVTVYVSELE